LSARIGPPTADARNARARTCSPLTLPERRFGVR